MVEISNKTLAVLLTLAIVISVGGAMLNIAQLSELKKTPLLELLGMATTIGTVNMTLKSNVEINLTTYEVEFGPGFVTQGMGDAARLNTSDGWRGKENWSNATGYNYAPNNITVENTGNRNCSVNFSSDKVASAFIGGGAGAITDPSFQFRGVVRDAGACSATNLTSSWTEVITANANDVCKCLRFTDGVDKIYTNIQVTVPYDAPIGAKNATLTFVGSDWGGLDKAC